MQIEAMACGKPVVSTCCGGPEDIITKDFLGKLVAGNTSTDLAHAMMEVVSNLHLYPPERIRRHVEVNFSSRAVARRIAEVYRRVKAQS